MYRRKLNFSGVKEFLSYEMKFLNEIYQKIKSFEDFEFYTSQSEPVKVLNLQLDELKKNNQCFDFFEKSSKILTMENIKKYSGCLLNDKSDEFIFSNLVFHMLKQIGLGVTFLFQRILFLYEDTKRKKQNLLRKIHDYVLSKKFSNFFVFCQNFFSAVVSKIWGKMEKNIFNDVQKHYLFTYMILDLDMGNSYKKDKFWEDFMKELSLSTK